METLVKNETRSPVGKADEAVAQALDQRNEEIEELLRIKRGLKIDANRVPCPSCTVLVEMAINRCPFCESNIAAETALARETLRRLRELTGELDAEHAARPDEEPTRRGFFERLKYLFEGDPEPNPDAFKIDPYAKRLLGMISPGDSIKVLDVDGPWVQVKTMASEIGWVYSTVRKRK